jgi:hypothetical protein
MCALLGKVGQWGPDGMPLGFCFEQGAQHQQRGSLLGTVTRLALLYFLAKNFLGGGGPGKQPQRDSVFLPRYQASESVDMYLYLTVGVRLCTVCSFPSEGPLGSMDSGLVCGAVNVLILTRSSCVALFLCFLAQDAESFTGPFADNPALVWTENELQLSGFESRTKTFVYKHKYVSEF